MSCLVHPITVFGSKDPISIVVSIFYWIIAASLAELASAVPSSGGVYHWASITPGPRWGRIIGFYAGWWNYFAWIFGGASCSAILGNCVVSMYAVYHPNFVPQSWHVFIAYLVITWACCCVVLFANKALPVINDFGLFFILGGVFITIIVCAIMPGRNGNGYASNDFVWKDFSADLGYTSNEFVFLMGMLVSSVARDNLCEHADEHNRMAHLQCKRIFLQLESYHNTDQFRGTPDCVSHMSEEIPHPEINIPKGIAAQMGVGFITALLFMIAIFYTISDLNAITSGTSNLPIALIYAQATGSPAGTVGLLMTILLPMVCTCIGCYITSGRTLWTLARDGATPFSDQLGRISLTWRNPFNSTLVCGFVITALGCIYVGSSTAFNAFVSSFVLLTTLSYLAAIGPHLLSRRSNVVPGPFWMGSVTGYIFNGIACAYIIVFIVIYCFPFSLPVTAVNMNYSSLITGGLTVYVSIMWLWKRGRGYTGPQAVVRDTGIANLSQAGEKV